MADNIWENALEIMQFDSRINEMLYNSIIKKIKLVKIEDNYIILSCRDEYSLSLVKGKDVSALIEGAIKTVTDKNYKVNFIIEGDEKSMFSASIAARKASEKETSDEFTGDTHIDPNLNFENFVVGNCNRYAQAASICVADKPGLTQYNPLFLWGNSGLGKTHLMQAIGNRIKRTNPKKKVIYRTCENFTNDYVNSMQKKNYEPFRNLYRNVDVLLIDDIQFLIGKEGTQEEFFNTFESLITSGKQIVITSDKAPRNLTQLDERLTSRFQNGYTMDVQPPDFETRKAILISKLERFDVEATDEVLNFVCENVTSNIRDLNGACNILTSHCALANKKVIEIDDAKEALKSYLSPKKAQQITPELIMFKVSQYYGISVDNMTSKNRKKEIITARNVSMFIMRDMLDTTLKDIGIHFGGKDHSTIINGCNNVEKNPDLLHDVEEIKAKLFS